MKRSQRPQGNRNRLRIIGGKWRGRRVDFPDVESIRPTPDRVRETLFNWLRVAVANARVLDLFAGSGALGLEALSRGAAAAVFVDEQPEIIHSLRATLSQLQSDDGQFHRVNALRFLREPEYRRVLGQFDVVFLDPPFRSGLIETACAALDEHHWLAPQAYVYLECEHDLDPLPLPASWELVKSKRAGQVGYHLARKI